jgi:hypothetical protein
VEQQQEDSAVEHELHGDSITPVMSAIENYFTEPMEAAATTDSPCDRVAGRLRWLPENTDSWPAVLFVFVPSRVAGGHKRFDRIHIDSALDLSTFRATPHITKVAAEAAAAAKPHDLTTAAAGERISEENEDEDAGSLKAERRRREMLAAKFDVAVSDEALKSARAVVAKAADAVMAAEQSADLVPAASAFKHAVDLAVAQTAKRLDDAIQKMHKVRSSYLHTAGTARTAKDATTYDLVSMIVHVGLDGDAGHYVAYSKRDAPSGDGGAQWCLFDDSNVIAVGDADDADTFCNHEGLQRNVYCLCYVKREIGACGQLALPPPSHLQALIEREDLRYQCQMAQAMSAADLEDDDGAAAARGNNS